MRTKILIACLGLISLGMQAQTNGVGQSLPLAGEWKVMLGDAKEVKRAMLPGTIDTNHLGFVPSDTTETTHLTRLYARQGYLFSHHRDSTTVEEGGGGTLLGANQTYVGVSGWKVGGFLQLYLHPSAIHLAENEIRQAPVGNRGG